MFSRFALFGFMLASVLAIAMPAAAEESVPSAHLQTENFQDSSWRRTRQGWQRNTFWPANTLQEAPEPNYCHPLLLGIFIFLLSLGGLIAFPAASNCPK